MFLTGTRRMLLPPSSGRTSPAHNACKRSDLPAQPLAGRCRPHRKCKCSCLLPPTPNSKYRDCMACNSPAPKHRSRYSKCPEHNPCNWRQTELLPAGSTCRIRIQYRPRCSLRRTGSPKYLASMQCTARDPRYPPIDLAGNSGKTLASETLLGSSTFPWDT